MALVYIELQSDGGQGLTRTDKNTIAAGAADTLAIRVSLKERAQWSSLTTYARFEYQKAVYDVPLDDEYSAIVPHEVCKYPAFIVSLWGENASGGVITTERVTVDVARSVDLVGVEPIPATPSLVQRFSELVEQCIEVSKGLTIVKVYETVDAMQADTSGEVLAGQFVSIQSGTDSAAHDGEIYLYTEAAEWLFVGHIGKDGQDGQDGAAGADGAAAKVYVSETITGEPGTKAKVENVGSATEARLKFTIPRGADGGGGSVSTIGGANLWTGTADYSGEDWSAIPAFFAENPDKRGNKLAQLTGGLTAALYQWVYLDAGEKVTISATVKPSQTAASTLKFKALMLEGFETPVSSPNWQGERQSVDLKIDTTQNENRLSATFTTTKAGYAALSILNTAAYIYWISSIMVERADSPSDWYPAASEVLGGGAIEYPVSVEHGGTGADNAKDARENLGIPDTMPIKAGVIYPYGGTTAPDGFLLCDGAAYSRTDYAALFAVIGTTYGTGNGSTTFNVPDLRGRVGVGASNDYTIGATGGESEHTLTTDEMPSHSHSIAATQSNWSDTLAQSENRFNYGGWGTANARAATQNVYGKAGGGAAHNNMQPYQVLNYIISTGASGSIDTNAVIAGIETLPLAIENGGTGATTAADALTNLGAAAVKHTHAVADITARGKKLWSGTLAKDKTITVPGLSDYVLFAIYQAGAATPMIGFSLPSHTSLRCIGGHISTTPNIFNYVASFARSGNSLTLLISGNVNVTGTTVTQTDISEIYGII